MHKETKKGGLTYVNKVVEDLQFTFRLCKQTPSADKVQEARKSDMFIITSKCTNGPQFFFFRSIYGCNSDYLQS